MSPAPIEASVDQTAGHVSAILSEAFEHTSAQAAVVVFDLDCELSRVLTAAYRRALPDAVFIDFAKSEKDEILSEFAKLTAGDFVALIQSTSFRLDAYRIRIELFKRSLKVIEHPHLARMTGVEADVYLDSLAYDSSYYRGVGRALQDRINKAEVAVIDSGDAELIFPAGFESAKVNIGDYTGMTNIGGQFPLGEVFTESKDLEAVHGRVRIAFFGDRTFTVNRPVKPITLIIEKGRVVDVLDSTPEFDQVLETIRADETDVWVRELGFGLNRAFSLERTVCDIGSFERMCGIHLSLGLKHMIYKKPNINRKTARHHVDVFALTHSVSLDGEIVFNDGAWLCSKT